MSRKVKIIDWLNLVLKQLALKHGRWISTDEQLFHTTVYEALQELGEQLPSLKKPNFAIHGAFPYSRDLSRAIWGLIASGCFESLHTGEGATTMAKISIGKDSKKAVSEELKKIFSGDPEGRKAFDKLVESLVPLVVSSP